MERASLSAGLLERWEVWRFLLERQVVLRRAQLQKGRWLERPGGLGGAWLALRRVWEVYPEVQREEEDSEPSSWEVCLCEEEEAWHQSSAARLLGRGQRLACSLHFLEQLDSEMEMMRRIETLSGCR